MRVEVVPNEGPGGARFGQPAEAVNQLVGQPTRRAGNVAQYASGWNLHYDEADRLEFAETWSPDAVAALDGVNLVGRDAEKARALLVAAGGNPRDALGDGDTYDLALGIGLAGDPVESVWVFPPNYYAERGEPGFGQKDT
jgi:hypothetical protein